MFDRLDGIEARYEELDRLLADPQVLSDHTRIATLAQERAEIEPIVQAYRDHKRTTQELADARTMIEGEKDSELRDMAYEEVETLSATLSELEERLKKVQRLSARRLQLVRAKAMR